jgi:uncharacterized membrane protein
MNVLRVLFAGLPALLLVTGIPLALGIVPPNPFYGFRTSTTFSSDEVWYQVNRATGLALIAAGIAGGVCVLLLGWGAFALRPEARYLTGILLTALFTILFLIPVVVYSDRF